MRIIKNGLANLSALNQIMDISLIIICLLMQIPQDILRLVTGMALLIPLSYPMRFFSTQVKFWYSLILGMAMQIYVFRDSIYPIYVQHLIAFGLIKWKGPKCGKLVTYESLAFLSGYQIHQIFTNYGGWTMNASALLMILTCKYSLLAYNLEDGKLEDDKITGEQRHYRIKDEVTFLDFLGYCNFLPTSLVGPPLEYQDYKRFLKGSDVYSKIPALALHLMLLKTFVETLLFAGLYAVSQMYFPLSSMRQDAFYLNSYFYVLFYVVISVTLARCKYYCGWKLSMCAVHATGVSFSGKDFSHINTVNPWVVQTSIHVRLKINNWNIGVQEWLRKCIYQRTTIKNKTFSQLEVFLISAFWHGFYGAYYISFGLWFVQLYLQGLIFKYCKNGQSKLVKIYDKMGVLGYILLSFLVQMSFSHCAASFLILRGWYCLQLAIKLYAMPQILLFAAVVVFSVIRPPKDKGDGKEKIVEKQEKQA